LIWSFIAVTVMPSALPSAAEEIAAPPIPTAALRAAAAAEQGWFGAAREEWQTAADQAGRAGRPADARWATGQIERLSAVEREYRRRMAQRDASAGAVWADATRPWAWVLAAEEGRRPGRLVVADGLVLWNDGRAIRGVGVDTGLPPWPAAGNGQDALLFPRGMAGLVPARGPGRGEPAAAGPPATHGGRAFAVIDRGGSSLLCCLDLSAAAEGRLAWLVEAAEIGPRAGMDVPGGLPLEFDGQPAADDELCVTVVRSRLRSGELSVAAFDARDGSLRWMRPVGAAVTVDGIDPAAGQRQAAFAEDRIVVLTHAGAIGAFGRDGAPAWRADLSAEAVRPDTIVPGPAQPPLLVGDRLFAAPCDQRGIIAFEPRGGGIVWRWRPADDMVVELLGAVEDDIVIATRSAAGRGSLIRLAAADGREVARHEADPVGWRVGGRGVVADQTVFRPLRRSGPADGGIAVEILDASTLRPRRPPLACPAAAAEDAVHLAVGAGRLIIAAPGLTACLHHGLTACQHPGLPACQHPGLPACQHPGLPACLHHGLPACLQAPLQRPEPGDAVGRVRDAVE